MYIDIYFIFFVGKTSWLGEFKRLAYHTPLIETEVLKEHSHQVLHVSFSHNGKMFATCSKDGYILVSLSFILQLLFFSHVNLYIYRLHAFVSGMAKSVSC